MVTVVMVSKQLLVLALVVGLLLAIHSTSLSEARRSRSRTGTGTGTTATTATDDGGTPVDLECAIRIVNALISSLNIFLDDFSVGVIPCQFTACAPVPGTNMVFALDCIACITSAVPFFGPVPNNTCSS